MRKMIPFDDVIMSRILSPSYFKHNLRNEITGTYILSSLINRFHALFELSALLFIIEIKWRIYTSENNALIG